MAGGGHGGGGGGGHGGGGGGGGAIGNFLWAVGSIIVFILFACVVCSATGTWLMNKVTMAGSTPQQRTDANWQDVPEEELQPVEDAGPSPAWLANPNPGGN